MQVYFLVDTVIKVVQSVFGKNIISAAAQLVVFSIKCHQANLKGQ